jgi:hypothetical protein
MNAMQGLMANAVCRAGLPKVSTQRHLLQRAGGSRIDAVNAYRLGVEIRGS